MDSRNTPNAGQREMATQPYKKFQDQGESQNVDYPAIPLEERQNSPASISISMANNFYPGQQVNLEQICIPTVAFQPQTFNPNLLDPVSRQMYDSLPAKHMSSSGLLSSVSQGGTQLNHTVNAQFSSLKGGMSYSEMLTGLLYRGERIVQYNQFQFLQYNHIVISDEANAPVTQKHGGICLLTDKRILLMSSQMNQMTSFKSFGDPKKMPGGYSIETSLGDTTSYLPIPYRFMKSVEMNGQSGVHGSIMIHPKKPCCNGLCGACGLLCGISAMLKQWNAGTVSISENNQMIISIGVLMPPWGRRMLLHIHVNINVPLPVVRDFVSLLQQYATELN